MLAVLNDRVARWGIAVLVAFALVACSGGDDGTAAGSKDSTDSVAPSPAAPAEFPMYPNELPDFTPEQFDEALQATAEGIPVVVNFWGSWCGPCKREAPVFAKMHRKYGDSVRFIGVNILDTKEGAQRFMEEYGIDYPSVFDPSANGDIRTHYGFIGQPATLMIQYGGEESFRWEGEISEEQLDRAIRPLLPSA